MDSFARVPYAATFGLAGNHISGMFESTIQLLKMRDGPHWLGPSFIILHQMLSSQGFEQCNFPTLCRYTFSFRAETTWPVVVMLWQTLTWTTNDEVLRTKPQMPLASDYSTEGRRSLQL